VNSLDEEQHRQEALRGIRRFLIQRRSPRVVVSGILMLTAFTGFFSSRAMLKWGLDAMWLRYPLAVLVAWGVFLLLVRVWAERERDSIDWNDESTRHGDLPAPRTPKLESRTAKSESNSKIRWFDWIDIPDVADAEGCLLGLAFLVGLIAFGWTMGMLAGLIAEADSLLAEVLLDAVLIAAFYHRLRRLQPRWWLAGAVRQTRGPVIGAIIFLMIFGLTAHHFVPAAKSIGGVWKEIRNSPALRH
jgi:hypothetical protein